MTDETLLELADAVCEFADVAQGDANRFALSLPVAQVERELPWEFTTLKSQEIQPRRCDYFWTASLFGDGVTMEIVGVSVCLNEVNPDTRWVARRVDFSESMVIDSLTEAPWSQPGGHKLTQFLPDQPMSDKLLADAFSREQTRLEETRGRFQNWPTQFESGRLSRADFLRAWDFATAHPLGRWAGRLL